MSHNALTEVLVASKQWVKHFNGGDADYCISAYQSDAEMEVKPMGSFHGSENIEHFWRPFLQSGASDLEYHNIWLKQLDDSTVHLGADWTMNVGRGIITLEEWVKTDPKRWKLSKEHFEVTEQY